MFFSSRLLRIVVLTIALVGGCSKGKTTETDDVRTALDVWATESEPAARIAKLLLPRDVPAEVLVTKLPEEIEKISAKLTAAAELDPHAFLQLLRDGGRKGPPPYDRRLGISREEYDLLTTGAHWELTKRADVVIKIAATGEDRVTITGLPDLKELSFEPGLQRVSMPYGELTRPVPFEATETQRTAGPLNGYVWRSPAFGGELTRYRIPEILLGQSPTGDAWLKLTVNDTFDDRRVIDYFVRFAGPPK